MRHDYDAAEHKRPGQSAICGGSRSPTSGSCQSARRGGAYGTPDFASRAGLEVILGHERSLLEELRAAEMLESGGAAEVTVNGDPLEAQRQRTHDHTKSRRQSS